ncbi:ABC transporter ATP-binding protein [Stieleria varia]|uniref:Uncharacterized protein n=1 Tax=Stieleria varia TaxID=2528005 RepID=A0A5C6B9Q5_9BACT|nr:ABC transporter ATP-binding protein [Stieleria varia]TWU07996.1 hypothetical protein Pla52n_05740 [Stieleria varia]
MASVVTPENESAAQSRAESIDEAALKRQLEREQLRISKFDIVTSLFLSLILFIGAFVLMMFIIWLLSGKPKPRPLAPLIENPAGRGENPEGFERDFEPPGAEEVEELTEPTLADTIEAVTDAVSSVAASLTTTDTNATASTSGTGAGDSRPPGPEGEGDDIIPRWERWELQFTAKNPNEYAKQLDFHRIELGAFGGGQNTIDTASNLSTNPTKKTNTNPPSEERIYFSWKTQTPLIQYDRQLLGQAGVQLQGRNIVRFIDAELENVLAHAELEYAKSKSYQSVTQIAKTVFECKAGGDGYVFEVVSQRYRKGK